jgi:hypothetical protein
MDPAFVKEKPIFEYVAFCAETKDNSNSKSDKLELVPSSIVEDVSLTNRSKQHNFYSTRVSLNESLTTPSAKSFLNSKLSDLDKVCKELNFDNIKSIVAAFKIINICISNKKFDISVSKSSEDEILIFSKKNNQFHNVLIDNDGDIQFILIGNKIGDEKYSVFSSDENIDFAKIAALL